MAYSGDPSTSVLDAVRFWLQDTSLSSPLLNDNELRYFIDYAAGYSADAVLLAAGLCSVVSSKYAGEVEISGDGVTYSGSQLQEKYTALATTLREQYTRQHGNLALPYAGGIEWFDYARYGAKPPLFRIGQHDNPRGSSQLIDDSYPEYIDDPSNYQVN